jgi:hypothetical protein
MGRREVRRLRHVLGNLDGEKRQLAEIEMGRLRLLARRDRLAAELAEVATTQARRAEIAADLAGIRAEALRLAAEANLLNASAASATEVVLRMRAGREASA